MLLLVIRFLRLLSLFYRVFPVLLFWLPSQSLCSGNHLFGHCFVHLWTFDHSLYLNNSLLSESQQLACFIKFRESKQYSG